jgi:hypothetical protein
MKKAPNTKSTDTGTSKKINANNTTTPSTVSTMKRKEMDEGDDDDDDDDTGIPETSTTTTTTTASTTQPPSSILPKKGRYKDDTNHHNTSRDEHATQSLKANTCNGTTATTTTTSQHTSSYQVTPVPQNQIQFTFGELPDIITSSPGSVPFRATVFICKRTTLHQILSEGNELMNSMLGISIDHAILQSMFTDCGGVNGTSKSVAVASTYVDTKKSHDTTTMIPVHHKLYLMILPEIVSRCNHAWSVHATSDAIKGAVGGSTTTTTSCRIVWCGTHMTSVMGSLTAAVARAFPMYTRKTKSITTTTTTIERNSMVPSSSLPTTTPVTRPRIHISFMDVSDSGIHESIPSNNGDYLLYVCESIQLAARLVDMVRHVLGLQNFF